jgi:hypothetical protein
MLICMALRPFPIGWLVGCSLLLLTVNLLIFGLENLIFLLYPYRPNQEGVGVFMRSILTFTAKGILFLLGVVGMVAWISVCGYFSKSMGLTGFANVFVFAGGMAAMLTSIGVALVWLVARVYDRFDPSQDAPALA